MKSDSEILNIGRSIPGRISIRTQGSRASLASKGPRRSTARSKAR